MSWVPGLCSVTFRAEPAETAIRPAAQTRLQAIGWSSDVHLARGETTRARTLAVRTRDAGLGCPMLGSFARATWSPSSQPFPPLLDVAAALGVRTIRISPRERGFLETYEAGGRAVADAIWVCAEAAMLPGAAGGAATTPAAAGGRS